MCCFWKILEKIYNFFCCCFKKKSVSQFNGVGVGTSVTNPINPNNFETYDIYHVKSSNIFDSKIQY